MANTAALHGIRPIFMTPLPVDEPMATERWMQGYGISYARVNEELRSFAPGPHSGQNTWISTACTLSADNT